MPNIKISALPPATLPLDDPNTLFEVTVIEAGEEVSRKITLEDIASSTGLDASFLTLSANAQLPNERVLTEGTNITFVDTGPNGTLTINAASATSFPLLAPNGSAAAPSYSFANDTDAGMFLVSAGILGLSVGSVEVARAIEAAGDVSLIIDPGRTATEAAPALAFGDGDSGFRQPLDDNLQLVLAGVTRFFWELDSFNAVAGTGPTMINAAASSTVPGFAPRRSDSNTGLGSAGSDMLALIAGGVEIARVTEAVGANQFAIVQSGASTVPELTSLADLDTGFRWTGANETVWIGGGTRAWNFSTVKFYSQFSNGPGLFNRVAQNDVVTVAPDHSDDNTGLGANNDELSLIAGGVEGIRVTEVASAITVDIFGTLNTVALNASGVAIFSGDVQIRDGSDFEIFDATNVVRALLTTHLGPPTTFEIGGATQLDHFDVRNFNTSVRIRDGIPLEMEEFAGAPIPVAGSGFYWVRDDVPNVPIFTDDAGTDFVLNAPAVSPDPILLSSGGAGVPSYSFATDSDTGMYNPGADSVGLTAGGVLGLSVSEVAGAITVDILDNLTIDATTGPGPHLSFINVAPSADVIDVLPTGSTLYNFATLRDQTGANFFFIRHDYSLSSANHRLDFSSDAHNDILRLSSSTQQVAMIQQNYFFDETSFHISATKFLEFDERNTSPVPGAADGAFWVRDDTPNVPMFTDDAGTDFVLNAVAPGGELPAGTVTDASLRWNGAANWVEETQIQISAAGVLSVLDAGLTDSVAISHDGTDGNVVVTNGVDLNFTGIAAAGNYRFSAGLMHVGDGDTTNPAFTFSTETNMGLFRPQANSMGVAVAGAEQFRAGSALCEVFSDSGLRIRPNIAVSDHITIFHDLTDAEIAVAGAVDFKLGGVGLERFLLSQPNIAMLEKAAAPGDEVGVGQFWVRSDTPNTPMFTDDAGNDFELNLGTTGRNHAVQARRTTDYLLTTAFVDITMDVTDVETDATVLDHDLVTNTDNIIIGSTGTYEVMVDVTAAPDAGAANRRRRMNARVRLNDAGTGIAGSVNSTDFHRDATAPFFNHLSFSFLADLTATDFITLQLSETLTGGGAGTDNANQISMKAIRLL